MELLGSVLSDAGFDCTRVDRGGISNLFARWGQKGSCAQLWVQRPYRCGSGWGRSGLDNAAFRGRDPRWCDVWARHHGYEIRRVRPLPPPRWISCATRPPDGAIILTITGDEEGDALDGTIALLDYMSSADERMSVCLVGEPTCPNTMGEMMKIGRRGSMTAWFTDDRRSGAFGLSASRQEPFARDGAADGSAGQPRTGSGHGPFRRLYIGGCCDRHRQRCHQRDPRAVQRRGEYPFQRSAFRCEPKRLVASRGRSGRLAEYGVEMDVKFKISGESFLTPPGPLSDLVAKAVEAETGVTTRVVDNGGTSDARFVKNPLPGGRVRAGRAHHAPGG